MMVVTSVADEEVVELTSLTIEISEEVYGRLKHEATRQGLDVATYVRGLLNRETIAPEKRQNDSYVPARKGRANREPWPDSPDEIVRLIRARRGNALPARQARANLASLLAGAGVDQGMSVDDWENRWAVHESAEKVAEQADVERTLFELRASQADERTG